MSEYLGFKIHWFGTNPLVGNYSSIKSSVGGGFRIRKSFSWKHKTSGWRMVEDKWPGRKRGSIWMRHNGLHKSSAWSTARLLNCSFFFVQDRCELFENIVGFVWKGKAQTSTASWESWGQNQRFWTSLATFKNPKNHDNWRFPRLENEIHHALVQHQQEYLYGPLKINGFINCR